MLFLCKTKYILSSVVLDFNYFNCPDINIMSMTRCKQIAHKIYLIYFSRGVEWPSVLRRRLRCAPSPVRTSVTGGTSLRAVARCLEWEAAIPPPRMTDTPTGAHLKILPNTKKCSSATVPYRPKNPTEPSHS